MEYEEMIRKCDRQSESGIVSFFLVFSCVRPLVRALTDATIMGKEPHVKDVIEFPDSTVNVNLKFDEKDIRLLDETEATETSHVSIAPGSTTKFNPTLCVLVSAGLLLNVLNAITRSMPTIGGLMSVMFMTFLYEWQLLHASKLTRNSRASFNYAELLALDKYYIPFYTMGYLFGDKYKSYVLPCSGGVSDDRTPDEPEARSPERVVPQDPKFQR